MKSEDYYDRMRSRRAIQFRVFLGEIILYLILAKGASEVIGKVREPNYLRIGLFILYGIFFILTVGLFIQCEIKNKEDRERYKYLASNPNGNIDHIPVEYKEKSFWETLRTSWASTWPLTALFFLGLACCFFIYYLKE